MSYNPIKIDVLKDFSPTISTLNSANPNFKIESNSSDTIVTLPFETCSAIKFFGMYYSPETDYFYINNPESGLGVRYVSGGKFFSEVFGVSKPADLTERIIAYKSTSKLSKITEGLDPLKIPAFVALYRAYKGELEPTNSKKQMSNFSEFTRDLKNYVSGLRSLLSKGEERGKTLFRQAFRSNSNYLYNQRWQMPESRDGGFSETHMYRLSSSIRFEGPIKELRPYQLEEVSQYVKSNLLSVDKVEEPVDKIAETNPLFTNITNREKGAMSRWKEKDPSDYSSKGVDEIISREHTYQGDYSKFYKQDAKIQIVFKRIIKALSKAEK